MPRHVWDQPELQCLSLQKPEEPLLRYVYYVQCVYYAHLHQRKCLQKCFGCTSMLPTYRLLLMTFTGCWVSSLGVAHIKILVVTNLPSDHTGEELR